MISVSAIMSQPLCVCVCGLAGFFFIVVSSFLPTATQWAGRASTCTNIVEIKTKPTDLWGRRVSSSSALCCSLTAASPRGVPVFGGRLFSFHHRDFRRKKQSHLSVCQCFYLLISWKGFCRMFVFNIWTFTIWINLIWIFFCFYCLLSVRLVSALYIQQ